MSKQTLERLSAPPPTEPIGSLLTEQPNSGPNLRSAKSDTFIILAIGACLMMIAALIPGFRGTPASEQAQIAAGGFTSLTEAPAPVTFTGAADVTAALDNVREMVAEPSGDFADWLAETPLERPTTEAGYTDPAEFALQSDLSTPASERTATTHGLVDFEVAPGLSFVTQQSRSGTDRTLTVISGSNAPTTVPFTLAGDDLADAEMTIERDGSVIVSGAAETTLATIAAPWAFDAAGNEVRAWYAIDEGDLILNIDHASAELYPVVADPSWWWWTKNVGWCAANVALAMAGSSAKIAQAVAYLTRVGRNSRYVASALRSLGGARQAFFKMIAIMLFKVQSYKGGGTIVSIASRIGFRAINYGSSTRKYISGIGAYAAKTAVTVLLGASCGKLVEQVI